MVDELSGGKAMYAYLRVTDPNTQLPKNVLVNWVRTLRGNDNLDPARLFPMHENFG